ncbi:putative T7SS-secreted protein [Nocardia rhizosphaerae]|uniref:T7SS-secreted protein n=1 Tax=Nocardia rhizosphaerae TaxID=1691571 RepID=A0ABV8LE91_9NOCA
MGLGELFDKVGNAVEKGVESLAEGAGQVIDDGLDLVGDGARRIGLDGIGNALDDLGDTIASATGGDVEEKELGQTDDPKELVLGEPSEIGSTAQTLTTMAEAVESTGQALQKIDAAEWSGKGADAFNTVYDKQPKLWFDGADAMTAAADAMTAWQNEVKAAQDKAQTAIDRWQAADAEERRMTSWWNGLTAEQQAQTPLVDTWTSKRNEAREILRAARIQRDNGASIAVGAVSAATDKAPKEPPFSQRWIAHLSDLGGVLEHGALNFFAGAFTATTGIVQFARQLNPTDIYNITHPAEYVEGLSDLGTGLVVAVADPGAAVTAILEDARTNPFEFAGSLAPDVILTAATGGGGSVKPVISALRRVADTGRRLPGRPDADPAPHTRNPTRQPAAPEPNRQAEPPGQRTPDRAEPRAGLPNSQDGRPPGTGHPVDGAPQRETPRTEDTTGGPSAMSERTEPSAPDPAPRTERDSEPAPAGADPALTRDPEPARPEPAPAPERSPDPEPPESRTDPRPEAATTPARETGPPHHTEQGDTPTHRTDSTPSQRTEPTPTRHADAPTEHTSAQTTDDAPVQRTDPAPAHQHDTPSQRTESTPPRETDPAPVQRTDPTLTHQADASAQRAEPSHRNDTPIQRDDPVATPTRHPEPGTTQPHSPAPTPAMDRTSTTPDSHPPGTRPAEPAARTATPAPTWLPATHPDGGSAPRQPDAAPARAQATTSPPPSRPDASSARPQPDPPPAAPRTAPDTPRAAPAPDATGRPVAPAPATAAARPDVATRNPDTRTEHTPAPDRPLDRDPSPPRDTDTARPDTPTDREHGPDTRTERDPDATEDTAPDRDPGTAEEPDSDAPTAKDRAEADTDAHDTARRCGAEHNRTPDQKTCSRDPVDIGTGEFLLPETDLELRGVLPLVLRRSHHSDFRFGRWFGRSWSSTLDTRVVVSDEGVTFLGEDGLMLAYPHPEVGDPVRPSTDGQAWTLTRTRTGGYRVWDQRRELIWHFAPEPAVGGLDAELGNYAVSAVTDRHHNRIRFHYDETGAPVEISHSGGYRVLVDTEHGRVTGIGLVDDDSGTAVAPVAEFTYTAGRLTTVTNAVAATTAYTYDADDRMTSWTDSRGNRMVNTYDADGRVVRQRGTAGILNCDYAYVQFPGGAGRLTAVTDSLGAVTSHGFDRELQLRDLITPDGAHRHTDYNADRKPLTVTGPDPATTTTYRYNAAGDPAEIVRPDGVLLEYEYTWRNRPSVIITADGSVHRREWSANGDLTAAVGPAGSRTEFAYHRSGALACVTSAGVRTTVRVDAAGLPIALVDPLGATTRIERDRAGRPVRAVDPNGAVTRYVWSPAGHLCSRTDPDGSRESWSYDGEGNLVSHTDPAGGRTEYDYGPFDLLVSRRDPDGTLTRYEWDTERRLTAVHNPLGRTWTYRYDAAGRLIAETDYSGATTTYTWDRAGRVTGVTPATGVTRRHRYDILGRRVEIVTDDGDWIRHTYDPMGRIVRAATGRGDTPVHTIAYTYGPTGLLESEQVDDRPPMRFGYDPHGRRIRRTSPTGADTGWHHDPAGRIDRIAVGGHDIALDYDLAGHLTGLRLGELAIDRTVTARGKLLRQQVTAFPARLVSLGLGDATRPAPRDVRRDEFRYRADGYLVSETTARPNTPARRRAYTLDALGRVTAVAEDDRPGEQYRYDPLGNIAAAGPTHREYRGNLLTGDGHNRYDYDRAGRLVRKRTGDHTWHYRYNSFDQLTDLYTPDRQWWHYTYDALGRRRSKQRLAADGAVLDRTDYAWDDTLLIESTSSTSTLRWTYLPDSHIPLTQCRDTPTAQQFHAVITDPAGTPVELVDPSTGELAATAATTTLWGRTTWHGHTSTPLRFPGQFHDPESGLHYNLHRSYDPETARYLTRDPLGLAPAANPNTYPHNPRTWTDPLGLIPDECRPADPEPDEHADPHAVTPHNPTPTSPTVDVGRPPVTPETVPDPNSSPGAGRTGTDETGNTPDETASTPEDIELLERLRIYEALGDTPPHIDMAANDARYGANGAHSLERHGPDMPLHRGDAPEGERTVEGRIYGDDPWARPENWSYRWRDEETMNRTVNEYLRANWETVRSDLALDGRHRATFDAERTTGDGFFNEGMHGVGPRSAHYDHARFAAVRFELMPGDPPSIMVVTAFPSGGLS